MFKRKAYNILTDWKASFSGRYAAFLQGARRVGKSTIAETFAKNEYKSYIVVDFANLTSEQLAVFDDVSDLDRFFLRLQVVWGVTLHRRESVIVFDEIQLMPKVRQAVKYLVKDGRYDYIETGSLISIRKNVRGIVIPSEEYRIPVYPMDYEEFLWACGKDTFDSLRALAESHGPVGEKINRKLMRDFRLYMAVGGMPQAVDAYLQGANFEAIDFVKRQILDLYREDFRKIDPSGRIGLIYESIPAQLAAGEKRTVISRATGRRATSKDGELLADLVESQTVLMCRNVADPNQPLAQSAVSSAFKLYLSDTGLFVTLIFSGGGAADGNIYAKLLSDKLDANLGYLYENAVAQAIRSFNRDLYYHTWREADNPHAYEVDFLLADGNKLIPVEVKSSETKRHKSLDLFRAKFARRVSRAVLFSQKDQGKDGVLEFKPVYLAEAFLAAIGRGD